MEKLVAAKMNRSYQVSAMTATGKTKQQLQELGVHIGSQLILLDRQGNDGLILVKNSRLALSQEILEQIMVKESSETKLLPLSELAMGDMGYVVNILGQGAVRRRLMDMGLTKQVAIKVSKLAPLGDPIELNVRGYQLVIRKSEAELVLIEKGGDDEKR
ncbi:MAG: ferrous iron transport protein A [Enterococcus sp.]